MKTEIERLKQKLKEVQDTFEDFMKLAAEADKKNSKEKFELMCQLQEKCCEFAVDCEYKEKLRSGSNVTLND